MPTVPRPALLAPLALAMMASAVSCGGYLNLAPQEESLEEIGRISGEVHVPAWSGAVLWVALLRVPHAGAGLDRVVDYYRLARPGPYFFYAAPGRYRVVAVEDPDRDGELEPGERLGSHGRFAILTIERGQHLEGIDLTVVNADPADLPPHDPGIVERRRAVGDIAALDEERFAAEAAHDGVYDVFRFIDERRAAGIFFLEPYDPAKTPVLFVHGFAGFAQQFGPLVEALDRERFQPWVFQYPSGLRLGFVAPYLVRDLEELRVSHGFSGLCLVAHSMGGLLSRHALRLHAFDRGERKPYVPLFVSIASPFAGVRSAGLGVHASPNVVPAWLDLDPHGEFVRTLYDAPLHPGVDHGLIWAHGPGGLGSDGVADLMSQLRPAAVEEARFTWGTVASHTGVLDDAATTATVRGWLEHCRERIAALDPPGAPSPAAASAPASASAPAAARASGSPMSSVAGGP